MSDARNMAFETQAVILAGGLGTRMRPITETIPKPMIAVAAKPFLQWQLELLGRAGLVRSLLLVSYLGEQIREYFGNGEKFGWNVEYSFEDSPMGTGGALKIAEEKLRDYFVLVNGDTYLEIDYREMVAQFLRSKCAALIAAYRLPGEGSEENPASILPGNLAVNADGVVMDYRKRGPERLSFVDAGVIVMKKEVLADIAVGQKCSLEEEIYPRLIERGEMRAFVTDEAFYDMGSPAGLAALEMKLR
jgi:NDP-sugar pyrophosphorylase family protein